MDNNKNKLTITFKRGGSYKIEGHITLKRANGEIIKEGEKMKLCRCGHSKNQPFCDNTHGEIGFQKD